MGTRRRLLKGAMAGMTRLWRSFPRDGPIRQHVWTRTGPEPRIQEVGISLLTFGLWNLWNNDERKEAHDE